MLFYLRIAQYKLIIVGKDNKFLRNHQNFNIKKGWLQDVANQK